MDAEFLVLGAGQEVGRSCVVLCCNGVNIMFDCGLHMGKKGDDRLPLLSVLGDDINAQVHLLVVTHFHLDHVGALPYLTEVLGYTGPVVMTTATKAIVPIILEDYYNICSARCASHAFRRSSLVMAVSTRLACNLQSSKLLCSKSSNMMQG
jgi:integrator complex subunit 11